MVAGLPGTLAGDHPHRPTVRDGVGRALAPADRGYATPRSHTVWADGRWQSDLTTASWSSVSPPVRQDSSVDLYWLPLGAGGRSVRWNGRVLEAAAAWREHRAAEDLYHSALEVHERGRRFVIEMGPVWNVDAADRGVLREGPVGTRWLGRFRWFRYEVRCWRDGRIPDVAEAVGGPLRASDDQPRAALLLDVVASVRP